MGGGGGGGGSGGGGGGGQMVTDADSRDALVLTLEETAVSAMTCDSLICSGRFTGFCLRFATDFETSLDDWKPGKRRRRER